MMNTETENSIFLSHAAAVHQMLLKGESQTRDLLFIGGARLHTLEDRIGIAQMVQLNDADVLHFGFEHTANGYELTELSVCMRRDGMIALARECRLWSDRSGERVILVPPADRFATAPKPDARLVPGDGGSAETTVIALEAIVRGTDGPGNA